MSINVFSKPALRKIIEETSYAPIERTKTHVATEKPAAVKEIDEALRKVCMLDDKGKGICEKCPYREQFFKNSDVVG